MRRMSHSARGTKAKSLVSAIALAVAVTTGAAATNMVFAPVVAAQDYSDEFRETYVPIDELTKQEQPDFAAAAAQIPALVAVSQNADEKFASGNLILTVGQATGQRHLQKQALAMMLESGLVPPEATGAYYYYLGNFQLQDEEFDLGRATLQQSIDAGYVPSNAATDPYTDQRTQILQSYVQQDDGESVIAYAQQLISAADASGAKPAEPWLLFPLQAAYDWEMTAEANSVAARLVAEYPTARNWSNSLRIVNDLTEFADSTKVDLFRLLFLTEGMQQRSDYFEYIEGVDPRLMTSEASRVLEHARANDVYPADTTYYQEVNQVITTRRELDGNMVPELVADANSSASGLEAYEAGEVALSEQDYATAEAMYQMSLDKGGVDANRSLTRLGIAQLHQGKTAEAVASFEAITGERVPLANMWVAYAAAQ